MNRAIVICSFVILCMCACSGASHVSPASKGTVSGVCYRDDVNNPIPSPLRVVVISTDILERYGFDTIDLPEAGSAVTNYDGSFKVDVPPGEYRLFTIWDEQAQYSPPFKVRSQRVTDMNLKLAGRIRLN